MPGKRKQEDTTPPPPSASTDEDETLASAESSESESDTESDNTSSLYSEEEEEAEEEVEEDIAEKYPFVFASLGSEKFGCGVKELSVKGLKKVEEAKLKEWEKSLRKTELENFVRKSAVLVAMAKEVLRAVESDD